MSVNYYTVLAPVGIYDVQRALGEASLDIGTLCTSGRINIWSKKKPIGISGQNPSPSQWEAARYGVKGPATSIRDDLATMSLGWTYDGAVSSYYRLLDYDGYYHGAIPPIRQANGTALVVDLVSSSSQAALFHLFMAEGGIANKPLSTSQGTASSGTAVPVNRIQNCICVEDAPYYGGGSYHSLVGGKCGLVIFDRTTYVGEVWATDAIAVQPARDNDMFIVQTSGLSLPMGTYTAVACVKVVEDGFTYYLPVCDDADYPTRFTLTVGGIGYYKQQRRGVATSATGTPAGMLATTASTVYVFMRLTNNSQSTLNLTVGTNTKFTLVCNITGSVEDVQGTHSINRTVTTAAIYRPRANQTVPVGGYVDLVYQIKNIWNYGDGTTAPTFIESGSIMLAPSLKSDGTDAYPLSGGISGVIYRT